MSIRLLTLLLVAVLVSSGCSSDPDESSSGAEPSSSDEETSLASGEDGGVPQYEGAPVNPFDLRAGDCFNEVSWIDEEQQRRINLTAQLGCDRPHDREVYHEAEFPAANGAPYPGEVSMAEWSTELCYTAFQDFVGMEYELSKYGIDFLQPTKETFEHPVGRHRRVICFVYDTGGDPVVGTARLTEQ